MGSAKATSKRSATTTQQTIRGTNYQCKRATEQPGTGNPPETEQKPALTPSHKEHPLRSSTRSRAKKESSTTPVYDSAAKHTVPHARTGSPSATKRKSARSSKETTNLTTQTNGFAPGVAVFVDLENVSWLRGSSLLAVKRCLAARFGPVSCARIYANQNLASRIATEIDEESFQIIGVDTSSHIVDDVLIRDIVQHLDELPGTVALVSGDGDFTGIMVLVAASGRRPVMLASPRNCSMTMAQEVLRRHGQVLFLPSMTQVMPKFLDAISPARLRTTRSFYHTYYKPSDFKPSNSSSDFSFVRYVTESEFCAETTAQDEPSGQRDLEQVPSLKASQPWENWARSRKGSLGSSWLAWLDFCAHQELNTQETTIGARKMNSSCQQAPPEYALSAL